MKCFVFTVSGRHLRCLTRITVATSIRRYTKVCIKGIKPSIYISSGVLALEPFFSLNYQNLVFSKILACILRWQRLWKKHWSRHGDRASKIPAFSPVVQNGTPPPPHPHGECVPPTFDSGGGTHSLAEEGVGVSQFGRGDWHCCILGIYVLCNGWEHYVPYRCL
jgi:hypothetical protein